MYKKAQKRVLEVAQQLNYKFTKKNNKNVSASKWEFCRYIFIF